MKAVNRKVLEQVIAATSEPLILVSVDQPDWPLVLGNPAFDSICGRDFLKKPFADVIEELIGRDLALEVSEIVRLQQEASLPVESNGREYLLSLQPLFLPKEESAKFYAVFWRSASAAGTAENAEVHHALLKAKRQIRDLSRNDPVTGLLNGRAFEDVFEHDWAVAAREQGKLSLVTFTIEDYEAYLKVFGRHATDSCLRRVGQAIRRCLRRASDVVARPEGQRFLVLSHATDEDGVRDFAGRISSAVRDLGLHHPRSGSSKFVTVAYEVHVADVSAEQRQAREFLKDLLAVVPE